MKTQGIKYAGSKKKLIPDILEIVQETLKPGDAVLDAFSGTTRVSQALARSGFNVLCNDRAVWSRTFANCYLKARQSDSHYRGIISQLNNVPPKDGWFAEHYGGLDRNGVNEGMDGRKKPWLMGNAMKLEGIRSAMNLMSLAPDEEAVALTSLILAMDKVDATLGHQSSYLKQWPKRAFAEAVLELPEIVQQGRHRVFCEDAVEFVARESVNAVLCYFDPPYGSGNAKMPASRVRYEAYYHLWKTIVLNDKPEVFGEACRRKDSSDKANPSRFEDFRVGESGQAVVIEELKRLLDAVQSKFVLLSWSSSGGAFDDIKALLKNTGCLVEVREIPYGRNVMSGMTWTDEWKADSGSGNAEYLFLVEKS